MAILTKFEDYQASCGEYIDSEFKGSFSPDIILFIAGDEYKYIASCNAKRSFSESRIAFPFGVQIFIRVPL